jgi:hypothetical protein
MVQLVLDASGEEAGGVKGELFAVLVQRADDDLRGSEDITPDLGEAEAALLEWLDGPDEPLDPGIPKDEGPGGRRRRDIVRGSRAVDRGGDIGDEEADPEPHLRRREPDALGLKHQIKHALSDRAGLVVDLLDGQGLLAERIGRVMKDGEVLGPD